MAPIACPILGLHGGDDARVTATVAPTANAMADLHKSYAPHVHPGAGHGFMRQQSGRNGANLTAARQAWAAAVLLLRSRLDEPAQAGQH